MTVDYRSIGPARFARKTTSNCEWAENSGQGQASDRTVATNAAIANMVAMVPIGTDGDKCKPVSDTGAFHLQTGCTSYTIRVVPALALQSIPPSTDCVGDKIAVKLHARAWPRRR
jgi:hypothetical protein